MDTPDRRFRPQFRQFVGFEFIAYFALHLYTCFVILYDYGALFAVIALICPVIPELYIFVKALMVKNFIYVTVFGIFIVLIIANAVIVNRRSRPK
jgi:hypothetical protein